MLFVIFSTFLHYRWRAHRGMPPLFYQRCFARRSTRHPPAHAARWSPYEYGGGGRSTSEPQGGRLRGGAGSASTARSHADDGYDLENLQAPPPAYDPSMGPPPKYAHGGEEAKQHVGAEVSGAAVESPGYQVMAPRVPAPYSDPRI